MNIYVNQMGYLTNSSKLAILALPQEACADTPLSPAHVQICKEDGACLLEKDAVFFGPDAASGDFVWQLDFTELTAPGTYVIRYKDTVSYPFTVDNELYGNLNRLLSKMLYYQRCGMELTEVIYELFFRIARSLVAERGYKEFFLSVNSRNYEAQKFYFAMGGEVLCEEGEQVRIGYRI